MLMTNNNLVLVYDGIMIKKIVRGNVKDTYIPYVKFNYINENISSNIHLHVKWTIDAKKIRMD